MILSLQWSLEHPHNMTISQDEGEGPVPLGVLGGKDCTSW
jgi:hypothetical protein